MAPGTAARRSSPRWPAGPSTAGRRPPAAQPGGVATPRPRAGRRGAPRRRPEAEPAPWPCPGAAPRPLQACRVWRVGSQAPSARAPRDQEPAATAARPAIGIARKLACTSAQAAGSCASQSFGEPSHCSADVGSSARTCGLESRNPPVQQSLVDSGSLERRAGHTRPAHSLQVPKEAPEQRATAPPALHRFISTIGWRAGAMHSCRRVVLLLAPRPAAAAGAAACRGQGVAHWSQQQALLLHHWPVQGSGQALHPGAQWRLYSEGSRSGSGGGGGGESGVARFWR